MDSLSLRASTIGIVGTGVMAEAMVSGLLRHELVDPGQITCSHPREARRLELAQRYGVRITQSNPEAAAGRIVILGVKPQLLPLVMPELRGNLHVSSLVLSVIAGASTHALMTGLGHPVVVRAMPNTPCQIGDGVTVWFASEEVDDDQKVLARAILVSLGTEIEVGDEDDVAKATAISGTGPTYVFLFIESMIDAAVHLGFPRHVARELVLDTVRGSAAFALQSGRHAAELRDMVTSPGGTSAAALYQLENGRFRTVISDAVWAAYRRTIDLEARLEPKSTT